jgi:hypothetical protein
MAIGLTDVVLTENQEDFRAVYGRQDMVDQPTRCQVDNPS